jgi:hypothetical protein
MWTQQVHDHRLICHLEQAARKRKHRVQFHDATAVSIPLLRMPLPLSCCCSSARSNSSFILEYDSKMQLGVWLVFFESMTDDEMSDTCCVLPIWLLVVVVRDLYLAQK